jgi:hypothetical protein
MLSGGVLIVIAGAAAVALARVGLPAPPLPADPVVALVEPLDRAREAGGALRDP